MTHEIDRDSQLSEAEAPTIPIDMTRVLEGDIREGSKLGSQEFAESMIVVNGLKAHPSVAEHSYGE